MYAGFDLMNYPGDKLIRAMWVNTNLRIVGFYLAHSHAGTSSDWTAPKVRVPPRNNWRFLLDEGWKMLPVFLGRQIIAGSGDAPSGMNKASGITDGQHAAGLADAAGIEKGATLYLDLELGGWVKPDALGYIDGWFEGIISRGYRKGLYLSALDLPTLGTRYPDAAFWFYRTSLWAPKTFDDGTQLVAVRAEAEWPLIALANGTSRHATAWQFDQIHDDQPSTPTDDTRRLLDGTAWTGVSIALDGGAKQFISPFDLDDSRVPDTVHPEARGALALLRSGPNAGALAAFVTEPASTYGAFEANQVWDAATFDIISTSDVGAGTYFDATFVAACARRDNHIDLFGVGMNGSVWTAWKNDFERWPMHPWVLNPTTPARKGSPIAAVSRMLDQIDVFFVNRNHELATNFWNPLDQNWGRPAVPISIGTAVAPASNIAVAVDWNAPARLDVAFISWDDAQVYWARWAGLGWDYEAVPTLVPVSALGGVSLARVGSTLHLAAVSLEGRVLHTSRSDLDLGSPGRWTAAVDVQVGFGSPSVAARLVVVDNQLVLVGIDREGRLWWAICSAGTWLPAGIDLTTLYSTSAKLDVVASASGAVHVLAFDSSGRAVAHRLRLTRIFAGGSTVVSEAIFPLPI